MIFLKRYKKYISKSLRSTNIHHKCQYTNFIVLDLVIYWMEIRKTDFGNILCYEIMLGNNKIKYHWSVERRKMHYNPDLYGVKNKTYVFEVQIKSNVLSISDFWIKIIERLTMRKNNKYEMDLLSIIAHTKDKIIQVDDSKIFVKSVKQNICLCGCAHKPVLYTLKYYEDVLQKAQLNLRDDSQPYITSR